jgi:hypothetical protein
LSPSIWTAQTWSTDKLIHHPWTNALCVLSWESTIICTHRCSLYYFIRTSRGELMKTAGISRREWHMLYIIYQHLQYIDSVCHAYTTGWHGFINKFCFWNFRFNIQMPSIIKGSISILSDAGLGMAMFSLGTPLAFWCLFINRLY